MADDKLVIDLYAELQAFGVTFVPTNDPDWLLAKCVFHKDTTPSAAIHVHDQNFACHACNTHGSIFKFLARAVEKPLHEVLALLGAKYKTTAADRPVENELVEKYHAMLWNFPPLLQELYKRGFTDQIIRRWRWGADERGKIKIPIANANGVWVNIMSYQPGLKVGKKFTNMTGRGKPRLYPASQLDYPNILLCGGPAKAVVAAAELNQYNIGCVSNTDGEAAKNWPSDAGYLLEGKSFLGVCLDVDATGRKAAEALAHRYHRCANYVSVIQLPLDTDKYPKGDINDYVGQEKQPLMPLIAAAERYEPPDFTEAELAAPVKVALRAAVQAENANKRLEFRALVSTVDSEPFFLPKDVRVICEQNQEMCHACPIAAMNLVTPTVTIPPEHENLLQMINSPAKNQRDLIRRSLRIPPCKTVEYDVQTSYHVNQVRLTNDLDSGTGWEEESATLEAIGVDIDLELNETYDLIGRIVPHPNTQRATAVISQSSAVVDSLSEFIAKPEELAAFQIDGDLNISAIDRKLRQIYHDLENNVTQIWERFDLHLLYDLCFHSALYFKEGNKIQKGVVEVLVVGDSSNGKSQIIESMIRHYGLGKKVNMENATVAGLLGGVDEVQKHRYISWGELPSNDRRLVFLDELKDAPPEVLGKLTDMRSSQKAEIPKIKRGSARARVRLPVTSNPHNNRKVMSYAYGIDIIREVIPGPEDIRRFDACMVVADSDVHAETLQRAALEFNPTYKAELCRNLVLFAWTRAPEQIHIVDWPHLYEITKRLCSQYTDEIPILDRGSSRYKILKLAIALAIRLYSVSPDDPNTVVVTPTHVEYIASWLHRVYSSPAMGYDRYSKAVAKQNQLGNMDGIVAHISTSNHPREIVERLLHATSFEHRDLADWSGGDKASSQQLISLLVRSNAIVRDGPNRYRKTVQFTPFLQKLVNENAMPEIGESPTYMKGML